MLGVTGAWAAENGTGIPWFTAGTLCTPDDRTAVADSPRRVAPLAPRAPATPPSGPSSPSRSSSSASPRPTAPASPTPSSTSSPSVTCPRWPPTPRPAESGDLEELKIKELKHCRLPCSRGSAASSRASPPRRPHCQLAGARRGPRPRQRAHQRRLRLRLLLSGVRVCTPT